jgi:ATP/maltotriose-dependent transcriptional regulator MalT
LSWTLYLRAFVAVRRGNAEEAIALLRECLALVRELRDRFAFVYAMVPLAAAAALKGDHVWAARIFGAADSTSERTGAAVTDRAVLKLRQEAEQDARARLGLNRWSRSYSAGRVVSIDTLINEIDNLKWNTRSPESRARNAVT